MPTQKPYGVKFLGLLIILHPLHKSITLILTSQEDPELLKRLIELGIQGYCLKGIAAENLILAVRSVAAGASWWDATATQTIRQTLAKATPTEPDHNPLTQREREVLELLTESKLTESKTNPEID